MATQTEIAYLSGTYARASDTFVRDEVDQLRQLGFKVHTIGIRRPIDDSYSLAGCRQTKECCSWLAR